MDLDTVADELYGAPLEEFTSTRNERAKHVRAAGDRQLAEQIVALRKPTQSAWLANQLVRSHPDEIELLLGLGRELRDVMADVSGDELRQLTKQRYQLVSALVSQTRSLGHALGRRVTDEVAQAVRTTLEATLSDELCADLLAAGRLTEPLEVSSAFGVPSSQSSRPRKLSERHSTTDTGTVSDLDEQRRRRARQRAEERVEAAEAAAEQAESAVETAAEELQSAHQHTTEAAQYVDRLRDQLEHAVEVVSQREQEAKAAQEAHEMAQRHVREADEELADAQAALEDLQI